MAPDAERIAGTRAWLAKAAKDLAVADHDLAADPPFVEDVLFHSQQATEKALKAFLVWHGCPFRKTHNLEEIGEQCLKKFGPEGRHLSQPHGDRAHRNRRQIQL